MDSNKQQSNKFFDDENSYQKIAQNTKKIYMSDGSLSTLLDFERVLDEVDIYAFRNWKFGELVDGPVITRYKVEATFMWPLAMMPDPRGAKRLLPFDCTIHYKKETLKVPVPIRSADDYRPGTKKAKIIDQDIWLVTISMPKRLIHDVKIGSIEMEDEDIDLNDLDQAYEKGLDRDMLNNNEQEQNDQQTPSPF